MTTIRRILVPFDFSPCSRAALEYAAALADRMSARLEILHVWEPEAMAIPGLMADDRRGYKSLEGYVDARIVEEVDAVTKALPYRSLTGVRARAATGRPLAAILRIAEDEDFDLIVMGTHGRKGLAHAFLGSVAEQVVRRAPCPVLTIGEPARPSVTDPVNP